MSDLCACGCANCGPSTRPIHRAAIDRGAAKPYDGEVCQCCDRIWCRNCGVPVPGNAIHSPCCRRDLRIVLRGAW